MTDSVNRQILRLCVAKICHNVGWNSIQTTPLEVLTDLLQDYMKCLAKTANNYALHLGNTEANINHLALAFKDMGISIDDLSEYVRYVDSSSIYDVPKYPIPKENNLNLLKPGSREVVTRPFHIHEHLPPMHPHLEDQELPLRHSPLNMELSPGAASPVGSPKTKAFKRSGDPSFEVSSKRAKMLPEDDVRPLRELSSVVMTTSGFLSPAREGKLPEARTPIIKIETNATEKPNDKSSEVIASTVEPKPEKKKKSKLPPEKKDDKDVLKNAPDVDLSKGEEKTKKAVSHETFKSKSTNSSSTSGKNSNANLKSQKGSNKKCSNKEVLPEPGGVNLIKKSPKSDKSSTLSLIKEPTNSNNTSRSEYKLSAEPDRQKLNIIKKISKVKDDVSENVEKTDLHKETELTQIDITIESVIKRETADSAFVQGDVFENADGETSQSSSQSLPASNIGNSKSSTVNTVKLNINTGFIEAPDIIPDVANSKNGCDLIKTDINPVKTNCDITKSSPSNVQINASIVQSSSKEKKRKDKSRAKKDTGEHSEKNADDSSGSSSCNQNTNLKNCMQVDRDENEETVVPVTFIPTPLPTAPGLIPQTTSLVPPILGSISKMDCDIPVVLKIEKNHSEPENSVPVFSSTVDNPVKDLSLIKKKEHKKEKKEKIKKKKKSKLKTKDKSEKKKLKLEKKDKEREKTKGKKEKKEKKKERDGDDDPPEVVTAVPKITLKIGPPSPSDIGSDISPRKIVIKPLVKKELVPSKPEKSPSPELARFSPLVEQPKPKQTKIHIAEPVETITPETCPSSDPAFPPAFRLDKDGNQVWICPACGCQDDGSPMVGCDDCDCWYHWLCVGITEAPESKHWYCTICLNKRKASEVVEKKKKKSKKNGSKKT